MKVGRSSQYTVQVSTSWEAARAEWVAAYAAGFATPFQHGAVLDAWFAAMRSRPEIEPLVVTVRDRASHTHALSLALVRTTTGTRRTIGFADLGLIDYNAPILGPAAPQDAEGAERLWRTLRRALPRADLIEFTKMPTEIAGRTNPFARLGALPCALNGNLVRTGDDWPTYHASLKRPVRKELQRSWRVFERHPGAAFTPVVEPTERRRVLAAIEEQQPLRMQSTGKRYSLDAPSAAAFYRNLVAGRPEESPVVFTALTCGDEVVAGLLALHDRGEYIMVRISNAEGAWANASPGRVIIDKSMEWLHGRGHRHFDFSIGNYDYKRRFGVEPVALIDLVQPIGLRGFSTSARAHARHWLSQHPPAHAFVRRLLGRPDGSTAPKTVGSEAR